MADDENQGPASPPIPKRGSYNIDFESLDESSNPFEPKVKLGSSPPNRSSSASASFVGDDAVDPFKPRIKLASSPPGSPKVMKLPNNNNIGDGVVHGDTDISSDILSETFGSDVHSSQSSAITGDIQSADVRQNTQVTPKKKKIVKKIKVQSKIRTPKNLKPEEDDKGDVVVPSLDESSTTGDQEIVDNESSPSLKKLLPRKKNRSLDRDNNVIKGEAHLKSEEQDKVIKSVSDEDVPCEAGSEAMASSSEIDHHFVEHGEIEDSKRKSAETWPAAAAAHAGTSDLAMLARSYQEEGKQSEYVTGHTPLSKSDIQTKTPKETLAKHSSSPEGAKLNRSRDELPVVNTPPQGKSAEGSSTKHPATRALEAAQVQADNSLKVLDNKNESSSEETPFYDAYDYPPVVTTKAKLGQKPSTEMERGPNHDDGGDSKGAVVQLVQDVGTTKVLRYSQSDWNKMKQDMELNFQASLLNKERDWSLMLAERDKKITALEETNRKVKHTNEDMRMIVAEFEKTISQLQAEKEKSKTDSHKVVQNLESERDQAIEDLQSVETAFSDLHRRYEKSKSIIEGFKRNEEQLKQCMEDLQTKLKKSDMKLQALRSQAEEKLDKANDDIEKIKKSTKSDIVRLEAALKKAELRISGLEESLQRKEKENQELTAICDELIAKVGS